VCERERKRGAREGQRDIKIRECKKERDKERGRKRSG